jgi:FkbH-like protein
MLAGFKLVNMLFVCMEPDGIKTLKTLLLNGDPDFWKILKTLTLAARDFDELFVLCSLRKKAHARLLKNPGGTREKFRVALLGGYSLYPFHELLEHLCEMAGHPCELWRGDFDNYISEIMDGTGGLYEFKPQAVVLMPSELRCKYTGQLSDAREMQQAEADGVVSSLLELVRGLHEKSHAEIIVTNFMLPARHDLGAFRSRTLGADWTFRKWVNLELGLNAPPYLHICDLEFLANRVGGLAARDERAWFESKQPCSSVLLPDFAREVAHLIAGLRQAPKKVLVLDLDNTLWGGVVADDGLEGIEIGDTSPRGEAFKAFQKYIASLKQRGTLLAVCSKNDLAKAKEPFEKHPEMVLRLEDFVSFKANWEPKSDNLRHMAVELNLGLDSFVFVDDNPAEIDIVRQFTPEVTTILLGPDPSDYVGQLANCRLFEPRSLTAEDAARTEQYRSDAQRQALAATVTDMAAYLESLTMEAVISEFTLVDVPRISQLINKSNQFNLTTRRRTEAEIHALMADSRHVCFSLRLKDRFGDHGLISIVIGEKAGDTMKIDTWLMSCRVLKRQVEDEVLNELMRLAKIKNCTRLEGVYLPTAKNNMVRDFYATMGFVSKSEDANARVFELELERIQPTLTKIKITRRAYEPN